MHVPLRRCHVAVTGEVREGIGVHVRRPARQTRVPEGVHLEALNLALRASTIVALAKA